MTTPLQVLREARSFLEDNWTRGDYIAPKDDSDRFTSIDYKPYYVRETEAYESVAGRKKTGLKEAADKYKACAIGAVRLSRISMNGLEPTAQAAHYDTAYQTAVLALALACNKNATEATLIRRVEDLQDDIEEEIPYSSQDVDSIEAVVIDFNDKDGRQRKEVLEAFDKAERIVKNGKKYLKPLVKLIAYDKVTP